MREWVEMVASGEFSVVSAGQRTHILVELDLQQLAAADRQSPAASSY
jgi:hypothetical protein